MGLQTLVLDLQVFDFCVIFSIQHSAAFLDVVHGATCLLNI